MRRLCIILIAAPLVLSPAGFKAEAAADQECMIGDAALCLASPNCWWDNQRRGCYPGEAPAADRCAAHGEQGICDSSSLNCRWSDAAKKCESKTD
ncbi:MAG TPA: hypothetical protein VLB11_00620 [Methyloceanibacter sp.]|nr:hypothetical protein [Methyloceanibacter sp.]